MTLTAVLDLLEQVPLGVASDDAMQEFRELLAFSGIQDPDETLLTRSFHWIMLQCKWAPDRAAVLLALLLGHEIGFRRRDGSGRAVAPVANVADLATDLWEPGELDRFLQETYDARAAERDEASPEERA